VFLVTEAQESIVQLDETDAEFSEAVAKAEGKKINICFQCGTCTATCPIRRFDKTYNPRLILRETLLGLRKKVLSTNGIWLCASCYSCTQRCPRGVRPAEVIRAIRNLAVREGHIHPFYRMQGSAIATLGRIFGEDEFINEMRANMNLPPLPPVNRKEMSIILQDMEVNKILTTEREGE